MNASVEPSQPRPGGRRRLGKLEKLSPKAPPPPPPPNTHAAKPLRRRAPDRPETPPRPVPFRAGSPAGEAAETPGRPVPLGRSDRKRRGGPGGPGRAGRFWAGPDHRPVRSLTDLGVASQLSDLRRGGMGGKEEDGTLAGERGKGSARERERGSERAGER